LAFAGTALLRHDWKIRQLTQQLITQNNHIDIATGILTASHCLNVFNVAGKCFDTGRQFSFFV
jgi:hypothetical protein